MSNLRKILLTLLGIGLFIFFLYKPLGWIRLPFFSIEAYEAIPTSSLLFLEDDLKDFMRPANHLPTDWSALLQTDAIATKYQEDFGTIRTLLSHHPIYERQVMEEGRLVSALQHGAYNGLDFLHLIDRYEGTLDLQVLLDTVDAKEIQSSTYRGVSLHTLTLKDDQTFVASQFQNLLLFARYPLIIEDAIEQLKEPHSNLLTIREFNQLGKASKGEGPQFYINIGGLSEYLFPFIQHENRAWIEQLSQSGAWLQIEGRTEGEIFRLLGKLLPGESQTLLQTLKLEQHSSHHQIASVLPAHTALALRMDMQAQFKDWRIIPPHSRMDFHHYLLPWATGELAFVMTEAYSSSYQDEQLMFVKSSNMEAATEYLKRFAQQSGELTTYDYQMYAIHQILSDNLFLPILGPLLNRIHNPFLTQIEDYVVFCNSRQALEVVIDKYIAGQTLARQANYLESSLNLASSSNLFLYWHPRYLEAAIQSIFKPDYQGALKTAFEHYRSIDHFRIQLQQKDHYFAVEATAKIDAQDRPLAGVIWKAQLQAEVATSPAIIRNISNGEYQIFIQDIQNRIYLLNRGGDILWSKALDAPVLSDIHSIDYYQNGDQQLLFNTSDGIYLMDDEGEEVSKFPIRLHSPATNGLIVVDFDGLGDYGYFVACENGHLYGFEASGRPLIGWNPQADIGTVHHPLRHFEREGRDYILALNEAGRLYVFKKDGSRRFEPKSFESRFISPLDFEADDLYTRIVATDQGGTARVVSTAGEIDHVLLSVGQNEAVQFAFADIAGDRRKDYVVLSQKELAAYIQKDQTIDKLFDYRFEHAQDQLFHLNRPHAARQLIGTLCRSRKQIFLFDEKGTPLPHFPLAGSTQFELIDLFDDRKQVVVVGYEDQLYTYTIE